MGKAKKILFVCTGNSCRSIMAEGLMREALKRLGKEGITVASAGVSAIDGFNPTKETVESMMARGIDVSAARSKSITEEMIKDYDLILVMTAHHRDEIIERFPQADHKTHILKKYGLQNSSVAEGNIDIIDPIGKPLEVYERTLDEIKREVDRVAKLL